MASGRTANTNRNGADDGSDTLDRIALQVAKRTGPIRLTGLRGASRAVVGARLVAAHGDAPVLFLTANAKAADELQDDLRTCLGEREDESRTRAFPRHDTLPYDRFSPQPFVIAQRMDVLYRWLAASGAAGGAPRGAPAPIVIAPWTAFALLVPSRDAVRARSVHLEVGQTVDRDALVETLVTAGYARMSLVEEPGEIAVRGGIVDLFPPHLKRPIRVELLGDEIESIREFDAASQRSQDKLGGVVAPPPRELLFDRDLVLARSAGIRELARNANVPARRSPESARAPEASTTSSRSSETGLRASSARSNAAGSSSSRSGGATGRPASLAARKFPVASSK